MHKIAVHCNTILIGIKVYPIWLCINYTVTLLQKENIARDLCACVCSESVIGQSDSSEQLGSLSNIFAYFRTCLIHCSLRGNERNDTACTNFIKSLCEKVVVNEELLGVVTAVIDLKITKRHIADNYIEVVVWEFCFFKSLYGDISFLIELLCNLSRKGVDFHTVELRACHRIRKQTEEIARSAGRLQNTALGKAQTLKSFIHTFDYNGRRVKRCQSGLHCRTVFFWRKACIQLFELISPRRIVFIKRHRQTAPTDIL